MSDENLDSIIEYGIDVRNRRIYLFEDLDAKIVSIAAKAMHVMSNSRSSQKNKPIEIYISSFGGEDYEMFALYDLIKLSKVPIHTYGLGKIMSAAVLILASGHKRFAYPNTSFLVHPSSISVPEIDVMSLKSIAKHWDVQSEQWCKLMAENSKFTSESWERLASQEYYFDVHKALEMEIIDKIIDK